jgi:glycine/D-amino acid oxidase-like deaminating enzyme
LVLTERLDLRGGHPCWDETADAETTIPLPDKAEIAIVGAGIMGAMLAERLTRDGRQVALIDRRPPAQGSTAASTALVMWAADMPLIELGSRIGAADAALAWKRVHRAVLSLAETIDREGLDCRWRSRPELYLAANRLDADGLRTEAEARRAAGLASTFLDPAALAERFGLPPRAALVSADAFSVDPVDLTLALLRVAQRRGATLSHAEVESLERHEGGIDLDCGDQGRLRAATVILATGYECARWYLPASFKLGSSFAIATAPGVAPTWREKAMLWEAGDPYLYARGTVDGRIIVGGEDEAMVDPAARDRMLETKRGILEAKGAALLGLPDLQADCAWSATFGSSPDGLPAIGRAANADHLWVSYGFGGNGITFASLAADLIADDLAGRPQAEAGLFAPYRFAG